MAENEESGRRRTGSLFATILPSFGASEKEGGQFTEMLQIVSKDISLGSDKGAVKCSDAQSKHTESKGLRADLLSTLYSCIAAEGREGSAAFDTLQNLAQTHKSNFGNSRSLEGGTRSTSEDAFCGG